VKFNDLINLIEQQSLTERDKDILATLLVGEAGGEKDYIASMASVMSVVTNRAGGDLSKFVKVATQPKQFSTFNKIQTPQQMDLRISQAKKHPAFAGARNIVDSALKRTLPSVVGSATHYYANKGAEKIKPPFWTKTGSPQPTGQVGSHAFFTNIPYQKIK